MKNEKNTVKSAILIFIALAVGIIAWCVPSTFYGVPGLTIVEQRVIAIFLFSALMWIFDAVPSWATSLLIITLMLLTISDSSFGFMLQHSGARELGTILTYKSIMATFADPIILLFLGGFVLAIGASKTGLDMYLAESILKLFGNKSNNVLMGFILVTAVFSMFISNTATAAMMLSFMAPVLKSLPNDGKGRIGLVLAIPVGANIGGIGTPIGTPPNAIALKYLNDPTGLNLNIGFGEWSSIMIPFVLVLLAIAWFILTKIFPFKQKTIHLDLKSNVKMNKDTYIVAATFIVTVFLWMFDKVTGVKANVVALIPVTVFALTGVLGEKDLPKINWSVLWMVAGGFALGLAFNGTGLAKDIISAIPFAQWSPLIVMIVAGLICWLLSNFISNTATAALMVPILTAVGMGMGDALIPIGGIKTLLFAVALSASLAMLLPISTPPNAIAHSTGLIKQKEMVKMGILVGVIGLTLAYVMLIVFGRCGIL